MSALESIEERARRTVEFMEATDPEGMISRPHICVWSDELSHSTRDVLALVEIAKAAHLLMLLKDAPKDAIYQSTKQPAWESLRAALARLEADS